MSKGWGAIETHWNGCRFRSRLEARWAVWLHSLGVKWFYEHEGFDLAGERYLPDFHLPAVGEGAWIEIKPAPLSSRERQLCMALTIHTKMPVIALCGNVDPEECSLFGAYYEVGDDRNDGGTAYFRATHAWPRQCFSCGGSGRTQLSPPNKQPFWHFGNGAAVLDSLLSDPYGEALHGPTPGPIRITKLWSACPLCHGSGQLEPLHAFSTSLFFLTDCFLSVDNQRMERAFIAARSARFEHGEKP